MTHAEQEATDSQCDRALGKKRGQILLSEVAMVWPSLESLGTCHVPFKDINFTGCPQVFPFPE